MEGSEEVDPVDDLVTAGSGQGPVVGAVNGSASSLYRSNPWDQVRDLETRIHHGNLGIVIRDLGQLCDQRGKSLIVFRLEMKGVCYFSFENSHAYGEEEAGNCQSPGNLCRLTLSFLGVDDVKFHWEPEILTVNTAR